MLSRNLGQTLGDVASSALQFLNIKDAENNAIDVNEFIGNTVDTWITNLVGVESACNHNSADTVLTELNKFVPAKAVVFVSGGATPTTDPKSQITGVPYKAKPGASYTLPYGQGTGETNESQVRADIITAVADLTSDSTVSFSSERF